jgi:DNA replication protein DnaC
MKRSTKPAPAPSDAELDKCFRALRLNGMAEAWPTLHQSSLEQGWDGARLLAALFDAETARRDANRRARLLKESRLPLHKSLSQMDEALLPASVRRQLPGLLRGDFLDRCQNLCVFGLPGRGKTHFLCALAQELVLAGRRILFSSTGKLIEKLLAAKARHQLDKELARLDRFEAIILDDIGYVQHSREEMEVLFTLIAERYERGSLMISSNLPFSKWEQIFRDPMTAMAAVDRLVQHAIILHFDGDSLRAKLARKSQNPENQEAEMNPQT